MLDEDEATRPKQRDIAIGADLSKLSVEELEERIAALKAEITRIEADLAAKRSSRAAADSVFKI